MQLDIAVEKVGVTYFKPVKYVLVITTDLHIFPHHITTKNKQNKSIIKNNLTLQKEINKYLNQYVIVTFMPLNA